MNAWIKKHPQRTASLLLGVFGSVQTGLALFQSHMNPLANGLITMGFAIVMYVLAWVIKNFKDDEPLSQETQP